MTLPSPPSRLSRARVWAVLWVLWFVLLTILSSLSKPGPNIDVVGFDKVVHTAFFAAGGTALTLAVVLRGKSAHQALTTTAWGRISMLILGTGAAVGGLDEWHQTFTPGRSGLDIYDWLADCLGSLLAVPLAWLILRWLTARAERT